METRGLLAVLILIIYCITMRKTISVTLMMITGFSAPPAGRSLSSFDFLVIRFFTCFSCYIFRTFYLSMHKLLTSPFLVRLYAYSSSFFAINQLFSKLSSENNSTKMFIKILKSISSYVYRCSLSLFIVAFKVL